MARHIPRLFIDHPLKDDQPCELSSPQSHYLINVLRLGIGDEVKVFNGKEGEWAATITRANKKGVTLTPQQMMRAHPQIPPIHLYFSPLKKEPMMWLIEKATELGVTDFYPIQTDHTQFLRLKEDKIHSYMIDASQQCERLTVPALHPMQPLKKVLSQSHPIMAAAERQDVPSLYEHLIASGSIAPYAIMIGPEGGWSEKEHQQITNTPHIIPYSLGTNILRAETAAIASLSILNAVLE